MILASSLEKAVLNTPMGIRKEYCHDCRSLNAHNSTIVYTFEGSCCVRGLLYIEGSTVSVAN